MFARQKDVMTNELFPLCKDAPGLFPNFGPGRSAFAGLFWNVPAAAFLSSKRLVFTIFTPIPNKALEINHS